MPTKSTRSSHTWTLIGGPQAGTISALSIGMEDEPVIFAGSNVSLYRSAGFVQDQISDWERLSKAPLGIMTVGVSPDFSQDHTVLAGTNTGVYLSEDAGNTWRSAQMPASTSMILTLCFSPDYLHDGIILAGTLEDGIFISNSRGERWFSQGFGLLDPTVYCLAFSPLYTKDGTIFAGTGTTVYYSYNNGRAWRSLEFPETDAPVLSIAVTAKDEGHYAIFAGTDSHGLFRSTDLGQTWEKLPTPSASFNALCFDQNEKILLAATEIGILQSKDDGNSWEALIQLPDAITLAALGKITLAGLADEGLWVATHRDNWTPVENLSIRSLLGLVLSPHFERDGAAFMFGPEEGLWMSKDGGRNWNDINEALPSLEINSLVLSPNFTNDLTLVAASTDGLLISRDAGLSWKVTCEESAQQVSFSPDGKLLVAVFPGAGIKVSENLGATWVDLPGPWDVGGEVLAISVTNSSHFYIAHLEGASQTMTLWQGKAGNFEKVLSEPTAENPHVSFWFPAGPATDRPWFASLGERVWKISSRTGGSHSQSALPSRESILTLTGSQDPSGQVILYACTGQYIYKSVDGRTWTLIHDLGNERAVAFHLSNTFTVDKTAYALLLGGSFCKLM